MNKKYFVNYNVNRQAEMANAKVVVRFLQDIEEGKRPGDLRSTKIEVGYLENDVWTSDKFIGGYEFLAGVR